MISVTEAKKIIQENTNTLSPVKLSLTESLGLILADDVFAASDVPPFPQSSMDGYAFSFNEWQLHKKLKIKGEIAAGSKETITLPPGSAARIFTGAAVPPGADTVVMQEKVTTQNDELVIHDENLAAGTNVREKGSEIQVGALALEKGSVLSPAAIGFLGSVGNAEVKVYPNPSISIIITGNELQKPGEPLQYGQVYESNSVALTSVLHQLNFNKVEIAHVTDKPELITEALKNALQKNDVVMLTGGISVGDYDFVLEAATACGVQKLFHKIKQRPGKPLYFGKKETRLVFGLPGNPASVLTCFYQYVIPALEKLNRRKLILKIIRAPLSKSFQKASGLTHFLKGRFDGQIATPLDAQESFRLSSFARANCLIQINEEVTTCKEGELVDVHLLPG
ncbi:MAG TPA: gephyrin-like molybdotransferase Glp [Chitinophagaceae bacterium]|jgi:molybdopterin molybdotransferase|nr:gephyrin-like molybdotransferase Glp [Chitinophagaceae bacterium]